MDDVRHLLDLVLNWKESTIRPFPPPPSARCRSRAVADHHRHGQPQLVDPVPEIVFAADRADLALASGRPCDPAEWIAAGGLAIGAQTSRRALEDATGGSPRMIEGDTGGGFVNSSRVRNPSEQAELSGSA